MGDLVIGLLLTGSGIAFLIHGERIFGKPDYTNLKGRPGRRAIAKLSQFVSKWVAVPALIIVGAILIVHGVSHIM